LQLVATASAASRSGIPPRASPRPLCVLSATSPHPFSIPTHALCAPALRPLCTHQCPLCARSAPALRPSASSLCRHVPDTAAPQLAAAAAEAFAASTSATRPSNLPVEITQDCSPETWGCSLRRVGLQPVGLAARRSSLGKRCLGSAAARQSYLLALALAALGCPLTRRTPLVDTLCPCHGGVKWPLLRGSALRRSGPPRHEHQPRRTLWILRLPTLGHSPLCCPT